MKSKQSNSLKINKKNFNFFLNKGYTLREILFKGLYLKIFSFITSKIKYKFKVIGNNVIIDNQSSIEGSKFIELGDDIIIKKNVWIVVPLLEIDNPDINKTYLKINSGTRIGPGCIISASNKIEIGKNVLFGPNVTVLDHAHNYKIKDLPISDQGIISTGQVNIEENCWLGVNSVIYSTKKITIGKNSVIAANTFVNFDVPSNSLVYGNPAKIKKINYD